jgi:hypothetical protein
MTAPNDLRTPASPLRSGETGSGSSGIVWSILLALFCSAISSAATWFFVAGSPAPSATANAPATPKSSSPETAAVPPAAVATTVSDQPPPPAESTPTAAPPADVAAAPPPALSFDPSGFFTGQGSAPPQTVAGATRSLAEFVLQDDGYVGPSVHSVLYDDLQTLKDASNAVASDDGSDPATSAKLRRAFDAVLNETIDRSNIIAQREGESQTTVEKSQQLQALLNVAKNRQSP